MGGRNLKIHVGRNQKFTAKNSWSKNSHGRQGLSRGPVPVGLSVGRGSFFHVSKPLQSNEKQTTTTTAKDIFFIVFSVYRDMKTKAKKQTKICIYIRYRKKIEKKLKKICKVIFFCCIFVPAKQKTTYHEQQRISNLFCYR